MENIVICLRSLKTLCVHGESITSFLLKRRDHNLHNLITLDDSDESAQKKCSYYCYYYYYFC